MKFHINLLQESQKLQSQISQYGAVVQTISIIILLVFGLMCFLVLSYRGYIGYTQDKLTKSEDALKTTITELKPIETKYSYMTQRVSLIHKIINTHKIEYSVLIDFYNALREKVTLDELGVVENERSISITLTAKNPFAFEDVVDLLTSLDYQYPTSKVESEQIQASKERGYSTTFLISF